MSQPAPPPTRIPSFYEAFLVWGKIGLLSFGGPAGQIGLMHRTLGGIVAGGLFVLPGVVAMLILSILYVALGHTPLITGLFFGLKAAVLAIVIEAVIRIGRRALKTPLQVSIAAAAFVGIFAFKIPFPWIVAGAAIIGTTCAKLLPGSRPAPAVNQADFAVDALASATLEHTKPSAYRTLRVLAVCLVLWIVPVAVAFLYLGRDHVIVREGVFFSQTADVCPGSGGTRVKIMSGSDTASM